LRFHEKNLIKIHWNSSHRSFLEFVLEIVFESGEVPIREVVPYIKSFTTIFYFKIFDYGRSLLE
jgi:hypothetical protein